MRDVPDDWDMFWSVCDFCLKRYHQSENMCSCTDDLELCANDNHELHDSYFDPDEMLEINGAFFCKDHAVCDFCDNTEDLSLNDDKTLSCPNCTIENNLEEKNMLTIIMRGAPGFGKTTYVKQVLPLVLGLKPSEIGVCSADDFHVNADGEYDWKPSSQSDAHKYSRETFLKLLTFQSGDIKAVVVDNTNINVMEMAYYWGLGSLFGQVQFHLLSTEAKLAAKRNVHSVPEQTVLRMADQLKFNPVPKYWNNIMNRAVVSGDGFFVVDGLQYDIPNNEADVEETEEEVS